MANECLITKLKGVVDNPKLRKIGELYINIKQVENYDANNSYVTVKTNKQANISIDGDGYMALSVQDLSDPSARFKNKQLEANSIYKLYISNNDGTIILDDKYSLIYIDTSSFTKVKTEELNFCTSLLEARGPGLIGDMNQINSGLLTDLQSISVSGDLGAFLQNHSALATLIAENNVFGNLDSITIPSSLVLFAVNGKEIRGNITKLANVSGLTILEIHNTGIYGSIEDYVTARVSVGETTISDRRGIGFAEQLTFGGSALPNQIYSVLDWDGTSKIFVFLGGYTKAACSIVYVKGATAEEISTWKTAGKDVWAYENGSWVQK